MFVEIGVGIVNPRGFGSKDHVESFPHDIDSLLVWKISKPLSKNHFIALYI